MLYIDLEKGTMNTSKLVKRPVLVHKQDGKTYTRMQWVDPKTGLPVSEKKGRLNQAERWSTGNEKTTSRDKVKMYPTAQNLILNVGEKGEREVKLPQKVETKKVTKEPFFGSESMPNARFKPKLPQAPSVMDSEGTERHMMWNYSEEGIDESTEMDEDTGEIKAELYTERMNTIYPAPLSIRNYDTGLSESDIEDRCGMVGPLNMSNPSKGTPVDGWDIWESSMEEIANTLPMHTDYPNKKEARKERKEYVKKLWKNIFGDMSVETLSSALGGEGCEIEGIYERTASDFDGYTGFKFNTKLANGAGTCERTIFRDHMGNIHMHNDLLDISAQHQGGGIAKDLYDRQIQLVKYLSKGHPCYTHLYANISIGVYAWAGKGYDFANQHELDVMRDSFKKFSDNLGVPLDTMLSKCGYNDISELKHSWQFASLNDGRKYNLECCNRGKRSNRQTIKGAGHLGKAFMLGGCPSWEGVLPLNTGGEGEHIYNKSRMK